jgi:hypothetical protein
MRVAGCGREGVVGVKETRDAVEEEVLAVGLRRIDCALCRANVDDMVDGAVVIVGTGMFAVLVSSILK